MKHEPCPFCGADVTKIANVPLVDDCPTSDEWFVIGEDTAERYNYCPNCGARMVRGAEDETDR